MYKGAINCISIALVSAAALAGFTGCNSKKSNEQLKAEEILAKAQTLYNQKQFDTAITTIDSLMKSYPGIIEVQRNAMHLKTLATEGKTINDSIANDSVILANKAIVDSLAANFRYVKDKDMVEGYYTSLPSNKDQLTKQTNIEARIDEQGKMYLLSSLYGHGIKHTSLKAKCGMEEVSTTVIPYDKSRNYRFRDGSTPVEMITFKDEDCDSLCRFIAENRDKSITIVFSGSGQFNFKLPEKTKKAIAATYEYATKKSILKKAEDLKMYYGKKLEITRKQSRQTAANISGEE